MLLRNNGSARVSATEVVVCVFPLVQFYFFHQSISAVLTVIVFDGKFLLAFAVEFPFAFCVFQIVRYLNYLNHQIVYIDVL